MASYPAADLDMTTTQGANAMKTNTDTNAIMACGWFLNCTRPASGVVAHPVLDYVACCTPCAQRLDLDLIPGRFTAVDADTVEFSVTA